MGQVNNSFYRWSCLPLEEQCTAIGVSHQPGHGGNGDTLLDQEIPEGCHQGAGAPRSIVAR